MTQIATNPSQSARLIACGVDPKSADMCYVGGWRPVCAIPFSKCNKEDSPAWSLSALLDMLKDEKVLVAYLPEEKEWQVLAKIYNVNYGCYSDNPIESCVKMFELRHQKGYKLNDIK